MSRALLPAIKRRKSPFLGGGEGLGGFEGCAESRLFINLFCVFLLSLQVARMYRDNSIGNRVNIVLVKIIILEYDEVISTFSQWSDT